MNGRQVSTLYYKLAIIFDVLEWYAMHRMMTYRIICTGWSANIFLAKTTVIDKNLFSSLCFGTFQQVKILTRITMLPAIGWQHETSLLHGLLLLSWEENGEQNGGLSSLLSAIMPLLVQHKSDMIPSGDAVAFIQNYSYTTEFWANYKMSLLAQWCNFCVTLEVALSC